MTRVPPSLADAVRARHPSLRQYTLARDSGPPRCIACGQPYDGTHEHEQRVVMLRNGSIHHLHGDCSLGYLGHAKAATHSEPGVGVYASRDHDWRNQETVQTPAPHALACSYVWLDGAYVPIHGCQAPPNFRGSETATDWYAPGTPCLA